MCAVLKTAALSLSCTQQCSTPRLCRNRLRQFPEILRALSPRDQLLMGLSTMDVLSSFCFSFSTFPAPREIALGLPHCGNEVACRAQAAGEQLGSGVILHNAALGIFCMLNIRFSWTRTTLRKRCIPAAHGVIWAWMLGTAFTALGLDLHGPDHSLGCWTLSRCNPHGKCLCLVCRSALVLGFFHCGDIHGASLFLGAPKGETSPTVGLCKPAAATAAAAAVTGQKSTKQCSSKCVPEFPSVIVIRNP